MFELLKELVLIPSVSGRENAIRAKLSEKIAPFCDECRTDNLGNLIALRRGTSKKPKKILLCAHMDEIGFIVNFVEDSGYLRVSAIGGIDFIASAYAPVIFENGTPGVLVPEEKIEKKEEYKADRFYIDIGASSREDAEKKVKIGDCAVIRPGLDCLMGTKVAGRPLDDRIGCAVLLEIASRLATPENDVYYVFSVEEEVGCRGAVTAAYGIAPDYALVFDVTDTGDTIGGSPMAVKIGGGAAIKIKDSSVICHSEVIEKLNDLAVEKNIAFQREILTCGGTDTSSIQAAGCGAKVGALSIPSRNIHTGVEVADLADAEACVSLAVAFAEAL